MIVRGRANFYIFAPSPPVFFFNIRKATSHTRHHSFHHNCSCQNFTATFTHTQQSKSHLPQWRSLREEPRPSHNHTLELSSNQLPLFLKRRPARLTVVSNTDAISSKGWPDIQHLLQHSKNQHKSSTTTTTKKTSVDQSKYPKALSSASPRWTLSQMISLSLSLSLRQSLNARPERNLQTSITSANCSENSLESQLLESKS